MSQSEERRSRPEEQPSPVNRDRARDTRTGSDAAAARVRHQAQWVDLQIQRAMQRGEFDNLPGQGKPLGDLGSPDDRDWWLKKLIEREQITGVLPAALQLRKDDRELENLLDHQATEKLVREHVEEFNRRVVEARRQLQGGPPVVTPTRDVDAEVARWRDRRRERRRPRPVEEPPDERGGREGRGRTTSRRRWFGRVERRDDT